MTDKIAAVGGSFLLLDNHAERDANEDIASINALIIMGNDLDIDPSWYIERYPEGDPRRCIHPKTKSELCCPQGKARATYEVAMIEAALAEKMPLLGICGGMHRINVLCGGTLLQHVPDLVGHERLMQKECGIEPHVGTIPVVIQCDTRMAMIARDIKMSFVKSSSVNMPKVIMENSLRHQSVDMLGRGLIASSLSDTIRLPDGSAKYLIEAIEADPNGPYADQFLVGVQWHPEFSASFLGSKITEHLLEAALVFSRKN